MRFLPKVLLLFLFVLCLGARDQQIMTNEQPLLSEDRFRRPTAQDGISCFWWWLNGNVTKASITHDLEDMHEKGFNGALIFDAGGQDQGGNDQVPQGPLFGSAEWRALFEHAVKEAHRLGLKLGLSIQSGWNLGGPDVKPEEAAKLLTWSEITVSGNRALQLPLALPQHRDNFYRDIAIVAIPAHDGDTTIKPVSDLAVKIASKEAAGSATDMSHIFLDDTYGKDEKAHATIQEVMDLTKQMDEKGVLQWQAPAGKWTIMRFGYTTNGAHVSTASGQWQGLVLDYMSKKHFLRYWNSNVRPLLESIDTLAGTTLNYLHTDSWELGGVNWTDDFRAEFKQRRDYDLLSYLPVIAGKIINSRTESNRFLFDFRKTIGDCIADNHYAFFAQKAHEYGIGIHPESGGPHLGPIDGLKNYGRSDLVMSEFWSPSGHRPTPAARFFVKQASSAAHIYGKKLVAAEGFTTIGHHWDDVIWRDMKPSFDHEVCAGLNKAYLHTFTNSPKEMGLPGQEYFAGTHFNPNITWWKFSKAFFDYMARVQYLMQDGQFIADVLYYYGDQVPNIATLKASDPAKALPDFDYDVINEECLLQLHVANGWIKLPYGMQYRVLVLPKHAVLSLKALQKIHQLVEDGATVIGPKTERTMSLEEEVAANKTIHQLANTLWGEKVSTSKGSRKVGKGTVAWGYTAKEWLLAQHVQPDCRFVDASDSTVFDYIHQQRQGKEDYYFLSSQNKQAVETTVDFRVSGKLPEFWNPETGEIREARVYQQKNGVTQVPIAFRPYGSWFVVFRKPIPFDQQGAASGKNFASYTVVDTLKQPWEVAFENRFGQPKHISFPTLISWADHTNENIKYYSGAATYKQSFIPKGGKNQTYYVDLGQIADVGIACVWLNGKNLGIVWSPPYRIKLDGLKLGQQNQLEVEVINSWRNRLVGDRALPKEKRYTQTNITIRDDWQLLKAGLLGPVTLQVERLY
ncbi:hypothetical protein GCM10023231_30090 [Olivibacter ginsenosidimutans]|uniref:Glycoside hydrolase n=2 Tax=Sphingobacteriaceae TaxID=84566 RepID=A0ABP9BVP8_9SPHI